MVSRRNTCTAVLFLVGIFSAALFLFMGANSRIKGFSDPSRPSHSMSRTRAMFLTDTVKERKNKLERPQKKSVTLSTQPDRLRRRKELRRKDRDLSRLTRTTPLPLQSSLGLILPTPGEAVQTLSENIDAVEPAINELLDREHTFIELYGGAQRLMERSMVEDPDPQYTVVKLTDGLLTFSDPEQEQESMRTRAREMIQFAKRVRKEYRTPVLYVQAPSKQDVSPLPEGLENYADDEADQFLTLLKEGSVDTLDLRPVFRQAVQEDPEAGEALFFRTDHHWTPAGAFLGYQTLCEKLEKQYRFKIDKDLTDPASFNKYTFEDIFLGSQGRRVGSLYAGIDDFEIWSPKFSTDFTYSVPIVGVQREGPFAVSLLFPERLADTGLYDTNPYTIYSGGDYLLTRAVNEKNPKGKRILILRDSFGCTFTPFLSLCCQEVMTIDPRHFNGNQDTMMTYIDWLEPDLVIVLNTTGSLRVDKLFPYLPTARAKARAERLTLAIGAEE